MNKKYFVFSDVHGEYDGLIAALKQKGFDEDNENHILFSLGDLWDRGPKNFEVAEFVIKYWEKGRFIGIMGNHDEFYEHFIHTKLPHNIKYNGFGETLIQWSGVNYPKSFIPTIFDRLMKPKIEKRLPKIREFINSFVDEVQIGDYVFTHGGYTEKPISQKWEVDNWAKTARFVRYFDPKDKVYVFGHWTAKDLIEFFNHEPANYGDIFVSKCGHFIGIDPTSFVSKKVNVLVFENNVLKIDF